MLKKFLLSCTVFIAAFAPFASIFTSSAYAADSVVFTGRDKCNSYLGLTEWDCGVAISSNKDSLKEGVWIIASNILIDLSVIAAYLVIGYVIYGGYVYITSAGDPSKVATGKKTLSQAFIGLAIVMLANVILNSIRIALMGTGGSFAVSCVTENESCANPNTMVTNAIQWVIGVAGAVAAIYVVYGGIAYSSSMGDPGKVQRAKNMILYACIGLAICALAEVITAFVSSTIRDAANTSSLNQTTISKEVYEIKTT